MKIQKPKGAPITTKRRRLRPFRLALIAIATLIMANSSWQLYTLHTEVSNTVALLEQEKTRLLEEKKRLENELVQLNTPSYVEQLAREQLGLVKKGEIRIAPKK